jgi:cobyrinic acid a,c-diamide synthase
VRLDVRRIVIAGVTSGVGKTTVACALMAAWRARGLRVQPFKVGPDYIDPGHHAVAAGRASRNLDSVLLPAPTLRALFARAVAAADIGVVEGVMGLFDGRNDHGEDGSTAQVARLIDAPVVVVVDVAKVGRTAGAIALGCVRFDPELRVAGFILNRVGSETHERIVREAIEFATGLPVLGALPRDDALTVPERHLGLVPAVETDAGKETAARLAQAAERHLALDRLWTLADAPAAAGIDAVGDPSCFPSEPVPRRATVAVARDQAFNFYYEDSLELLAAWGADIAPFSPLADRNLPSGVQGVYLGGGFPEIFAAELAENLSMQASLRRVAACGLPIYGECGGLMYLGRALTDFEARHHQMVGLLPLDSAMQRRRVTLGYRTATALRPSLLLDGGECVMGHEFHYSELAAPPGSDEAAYRLAERGDALEGYAAGNVLASYVHVHFGSNPAMARRLVDACSRMAPL